MCTNNEDEIFSVKNGNTIEEEAKDVNRLVEAAKIGQWNTVWTILGTPDSVKKAYLINAIPEKRRWGVLHQAVYWNDPSILRLVLRFKACDSDMKAKKCMSECGATGRMTALEVANAYNYLVMSSILSNHMSNTVREQDIPTFQPYANYCDNKGLCLLSVTLSSYKQAFHPAPVNPNKSVLSILSDIFNDLCRNNDRWKKVQAVVADSVYAVSPDKADDILQCIDRESFFGQVVRSYTNENNSIYSYLNMAFRRQKQTDYRPSGDDLAMGPYCVMYQILLLFWKNLEAESSPTYRKMQLTRRDSDQYQNGTRFVWQSIVSSALQRTHTHAFPTHPTLALAGYDRDVVVIFTIDNSTQCEWQPRNIENLAEFEETERTYPAGAKFLVTGRTAQQNGEVHVSLKLLPK